MIRFACGVCGKQYAVAEALAGRGARCACGASLMVPLRSESSPEVKSMGSAGAGEPARVAPISGGVLRTRRVRADADALRAWFTEEHPVAKLSHIEGDPPTAFEIELRVRGTVHGPDRSGNIQPSDRHVMRIELTSEYPRSAPRCRMLTPVFHPNIDKVSICIGDHWSAGERLGDLVLRVAEMIAYQAYNIQSPLNAEAAMWADLNQSKLPLDPRDLRQGI